MNKDGKLRTKWFHKPIASNRLLNFNSKHPKHMIQNTAKSFIRRVLSLSHSSHHIECKEKIREILIKNNFPAKNIDQMIQQVNSSRNRNQTNNVSYPFLQTTMFQQSMQLNNTVPIDQEDEQVRPKTSTETEVETFDDSTTNAPPTQSAIPTKKPKFGGMTYVPGLSEALAKKLREAAPDLRIAFRTPYKVSSLYSDMKQKVPESEQSCVVYSIPCQVCPNKRYIGETRQKAAVRKGQHKTDVKNQNKNPRKSALVYHTHKTGHEFNFEAQKIIKKVRNPGTLKMHEANQIILHENEVVNFKKDAEHISPVFYNLIKNTKKHRKKKKKLQNHSVNPSTSVTVSE